MTGWRWSSRGEDEPRGGSTSHQAHSRRWPDIWTGQGVCCCRTDQDVSVVVFRFFFPFFFWLLTAFSGFFFFCKKKKDVNVGRYIKRLTQRLYFHGDFENWDDYCLASLKRNVFIHSSCCSEREKRKMYFRVRSTKRRLTEGRNRMEVDKVVLNNGEESS